MPAEQRGSAYRLKGGGWGLFYRDQAGKRKRQSPFRSRSEALRWFQDVERKRQLGLPVATPDVTFSVFVGQYLEAHAVGRETSTIQTLAHRLSYAERVFGDLLLSDFERRTSEIAAWRRTLPPGSRRGIMQALSQALDAAIRWGLMSQNPAKLAGANPQARPPEIEPFAREEIDRLAVELGPWGALVVFAAETALRPSEWIALERRDLDAQEGIVVVERTFSRGHVRGYGKTARSRRRVPLSTRAVAALDELPRRIDTKLLFPSPKGGYLDLHNFRAREWKPALEAAGLSRGRIYDLRHTGISNWLAAGLSLFEVSRYAGTSVQMIDRVYGHLVRGSEQAARAKLDAHADRLARLGHAGEATSATEEERN